MTIEELLKELKKYPKETEVKLLYIVKSYDEWYDDEDEEAFVERIYKRDTESGSEVHICAYETKEFEERTALFQLIHGK